MMSFYNLLLQEVVEVNISSSFKEAEKKIIDTGSSRF